jgi:hypothetical protein
MPRIICETKNSTRSLNTIFVCLKYFDIVSLGMKEEEEEEEVVVGGGEGLSETHNTVAESPARDGQEGKVRRAFDF